MNSEKFISMVHLIIHTCQDPEQLGLTRLHRSLWFSEAMYFLNWGESITGERYIRDQYGPIAKSLDIVLDILLCRGAIRIENSTYDGCRKDHFISLASPELSRFKERETEIIKDVSRQICEDDTSGTISALSHTRIWEVAERWEEIPHEALFMARRGKLTEQDWAQVKKEIAARQ